MFSWRAQELCSGLNRHFVALIYFEEFELPTLQVVLKGISEN